MHKTTYKIIKRSTYSIDILSALQSVELEIQDHIENGWGLYKSLLVESLPNNEIIIAQQMVKYEMIDNEN